jgi:hypothetical protein
VNAPWIEHHLLHHISVGLLSTTCGNFPVSFRADAPHVCPLELIIQQGLQSPACLQRLGGDVHDRIPSTEGCTSQNFSMIIHVLTGMGKIYKDRGPSEVPLPPGPGPGNLLLEGNSLEYSLSGSNPRTNCSSGHHCALCSQSSEPTLRSFDTEMFWRRLTLSARWGTLAWTVDNATNGHCDFSQSDGSDQYLSRDRRRLTRSCGRSLRPPAARLAIIGYCQWNMRVN